MNRTPEQAIGCILVLSGPSGVGKSTVIGLLSKLHANLHFSVSCTTRAPRPGDIPEVSYHFLTEEAFHTHQIAGDFLESAEVHGKHYGTLLRELEPIHSNQDILLDIDVQGMRRVKNRLASEASLNPRLITVFLMPPSLTELERRLRGRQSDSEEAILKRLNNAKGEMAAWKEYDYVLVNRDSEESARTLDALLQAAHYRTTIITEESWNNE